MAKDNNRIPVEKSLKFMNVADQAFDQAKYEVSIQYYTQAIDCVNTSANLAYSLYMRGQAYLETGLSVKACKDWLKAQKLGFEHPWGTDPITESLNSL